MSATLKQKDFLKAVDEIVLELTVWHNLKNDGLTDSRVNYCKGAIMAYASTLDIVLSNQTKISKEI